MHANIDLILTLTGGLAAALVLGYITQRLGLSPIVGYLLAGIVVGPNTRGFVADRHLAEQLGEVGVILLMFGVGLQFHFEELLAVRRIAVPGAVIQSLLATALGALTGWAFGWGWSAGLVYGMAISVAALGLSVIPPPDVVSWPVFEAKVLGGSVLLGGLGWAIFSRNREAASA